MSAMTLIKVEHLNGYRLTWVRLPHMPWILAESVYEEAPTA